MSVRARVQAWVWERVQAWVWERVQAWVRARVRAWVQGGCGGGCGAGREHTGEGNCLDTHLLRMATKSTRVDARVRVAAAKRHQGCESTRRTSDGRQPFEPPDTICPHSPPSSSWQEPKGQAPSRPQATSRPLRTRESIGPSQSESVTPSLHCRHCHRHRRRRRRRRRRHPPPHPHPRRRRRRSHTRPPRRGQLHHPRPRRTRRGRSPLSHSLHHLLPTTLSPGRHHARQTSFRSPPHPGWQTATATTNKGGVGWGLASGYAAGGPGSRVPSSRATHHVPIRITHL